MRLVLIGSTHLTLRCLDCALALPSVEVAGVLTNRERFEISYSPAGVRNVLFQDMADAARSRGIPAHVMPGGMRDPALAGTIAGWRPDFILVAGWYHKVPRAIRDLAPTAGLHASLLPDYAGGAPLVWAIINGETKTGITLFMLAEQIDAGPIIAQAELPILFEDTIATLYARVESAAVGLIEKELPRIDAGDLAPTPQDLAGRRVMPQRTPADGEIDWHQPAGRIYDFIRAQTRPYPGAFTFLGTAAVTIWRARPGPGRAPAGTPPGTIDVDPDSRGISAACGAGELLRIDEYECRGARDDPHGAPENELRLTAGDRFGRAAGGAPGG